MTEWGLLSFEVSLYLPGLSGSMLKSYLHYGSMSCSVCSQLGEPSMSSMPQLQYVLKELVTSGREDRTGQHSQLPSDEGFGVHMSYGDVWVNSMLWVEIRIKVTNLAMVCLLPDLVHQ